MRRAPAVHVALLRAVNVAGHGMVGMEALRAAFARLGFAGARTLLQSGNVVFDAGGAGGARGARSAPALEALIEAELEKALGVTTVLFVRTAAEWEAALAANPFTAEAKRDPGHLLVLALKSPAPAGAGDALRAAIVGRESVHVEGRYAWAFYPDGVGRSKLTTAVIERTLGTRVTARNWNTARKLADLARG